MSDLQTQIPQQEPKHNHYFRIFKGIRIDFYFIMSLFGVTDQAVGHAIKKLMFAGVRGAKDQKKDLQEAIDSIQRKLEILQVLEEESSSSIKSKIEKEPPAWATHKAEGWNGMHIHSFKTPLGTYEARMHPAMTFECWRVYLDGVELESGKCYQTCGEAARACELHFEILKTPSSI